MGVKKVVSERIDQARTFADKVRDVYQEAYKKAVETSKDELGKVKSLEPRIRAAIGEGLQSAQTALDDFNQSLADKAIPAFRRGAVSKEQLNKKSEQVIEQSAKKSKVATATSDKAGSKQSKSRKRSSTAQTSKKS